eukprot:66747-Pyramimonas_sp.AAC.1
MTVGSLECELRVPRTRDEVGFARIVGIDAAGEVHRALQDGGPCRAQRLTRPDHVVEGGRRCGRDQLLVQPLLVGVRARRGIARPRLSP